MPRKSIGPPTRIQTGALLEDLRKQMGLVLDGVHGLRTTLERKIDESEARSNLRHDVTDASIRHLVSEVSDLKTSQARLEVNLEQGLREVSARLDEVVTAAKRHALRISKLEAVPRPPPLAGGRPTRPSR